MNLSSLLSNVLERPDVNGKQVTRIMSLMVLMKIFEDEGTAMDLPGLLDRGGSLGGGSGIENMLLQLLMNRISRPDPVRALRTEAAATVSPDEMGTKL